MTVSARIAVVIALASLTACGPKTRWDHTPQDVHIVRGGETLSAIAFRYGKDPNALAYWNRLGDPSLIYPGQEIRLTPPAGMQTAPPRRTSASSTARQSSNSALPPIPNQPSPPLRWPTAGNVVVEFGKRPGTGTGVLIAGQVGQPVEAAAAGRVVYSGGGLIGYGQLIILKHNDTYLSAYGYNDSLLVREGEAVKKGQRIATMGEGPGRKPRLHFEIRKNGKPVNPRQFLPAR